MKMPWVCAFEELDKSKLSWVGGKGANLGELRAQGFPVPDGFCVTTSAYRAFLSTGDAAQIEGFFAGLDALEQDDTESARRLGKEIRAALLALSIPRAVEEAIVEAWTALGSDRGYAVRSSATAEDLPEASFAGQQDTYLNVRGKGELLEHVRQCWASLFTDRAIVYRAANGFDHRDVALSVVIQKMVLPEISGILFSADPLSENRHITSIDASYGLGEALVSGMVTPDLYRVDRRSAEVIEARIADKQMALRPLPQGGTIEEALSEELRHSRVLSDSQVQELSALGAQIEAYYGVPQDVEWCLEDGQFFIVQSRPVTSLYPEFERPHPDDSLQAYFCINYQQVMTEPLTPMGLSCVNCLLPFGKWDEPTLTRNPVLNSAGGRVYGNFTKVLRHPRLGKVVVKILSMMDELASRSMAQFMERERFRREATRNPVVSLPWVARNIAFPLLRRALGLVFFKDTSGVVEHRTKLLDELTAEVEVEIERHRGDPAARLQATVHQLCTLFRRRVVFSYFPVMMSGILSLKLLERLTGKAASDPDMAEFTRAYAGNVTTDMDLELGDIADVVRSYPELLAHLRSQPVASALEAAGELEGGQEFLDAFEGFVQKYKDRAASEIDIARERWGEDPTPLLQMLAGMLGDPEIGRHRKHHEALAAQAEKAGERLIEAAGRGLKKKLARRLVKVHRDLMGIREHHKWMAMRMFGLVKRVLKQEAEGFVRAGQLEEPGDIFFLDWDEVLALAEGDPQGQGLSARIAQRKEKYRKWFSLTPPRLLTSEGEIIRAQFSLADAPAGALVGSPASAGVVEGRARVLRSPTDALLHRGEILVAPFTDPGWTPLFIHAGGLVMEVGGLMTHGSVVAREYGIPAVVCVPGATTRIETGQWLRVHGDMGYVELLDEPTPSDDSEASVAGDVANDV